MIHLLIAIAFSAMIPVLLKYAHQAKVSDEVVLSGNYFLAILISLAFTLYKLDTYKSLWSDPGKLTGLMAIGLATGLFFYGAFYYYQKSVRENGVSLSIAVGKMGILIPVILSLILWQEFPTSIQWIGIILSLIAIGLINIHPEDFRKLHIRLSLLLFFIIGGLGDFGNKLFETLIGAQYKDIFLLIVFTTAFIASLFMTLKHKRITFKAIRFGLAVGGPNMLTAFFLISALDILKAAIVFPTYSGGAIILSIIYSFFAFKEKLHGKEIAAITLVIAALVLINM